MIKLKKINRQVKPFVCFDMMLVKLALVDVDWRAKQHIGWLLQQEIKAAGFE